MQMIKEYSDVLLIVLCVEFFVTAFICIHLQSKTKRFEKEINVLELKTKETEKQMDHFLKKTNTLENTLFMQEVRRNASELTEVQEKKSGMRNSEKRE